MNKIEYSDRLNLDEIAELVPPIHPALDWVKGQLIMGVVDTNGKRAILSSKGSWVSPKELGRPICPKGREFTSPVTTVAAKTFLEGQGTNIQGASGEAVAGKIASYLRRLLAFPEDWMADAVSVWILATYVYPVFQAFPYIRITSASPGCGKSVLGQAIARLAFKGEFMAAPNEAHLFRMAERSRGVQVWDEVEATGEGRKRRFENIESILLNGYRNGGVVPRTRANNYDVIEEYHVFCPRVLIGLSELPQAARERTITIRMEKLPKEHDAEMYDPTKHDSEEEALRNECIVWALRNAPAVATSYYDRELRKRVAEGVGEVGRQADDIWLPLLAVLHANVSDKAQLPQMTVSLFAGAKSHRSRGAEAEAAKNIPSPDAAAEDTVGSVDGNELVEAALPILASRKTILPAELAELVSTDVGREISIQKLSKALAKEKIRTERQRGMRVFVVSKKQLDAVRRRLGIHDIGQEGREGQESTVYVGEEVVSVG